MASLLITQQMRCDSQLRETFPPHPILSHSLSNTFYSIHSSKRTRRTYIWYLPRPVKNLPSVYRIRTEPTSESLTWATTTLRWDKYRFTWPQRCVRFLKAKPANSNDFRRWTTIYKNNNKKTTARLSPTESFDAKWCSSFANGVPSFSFELLLCLKHPTIFFCDIS